VRVGPVARDPCVSSNPSAIGIYLYEPPRDLKPSRRRRSRTAARPLRSLRSATSVASRASHSLMTDPILGDGVPCEAPAHYRGIEDSTKNRQAFTRDRSLAAVSVDRSISIRSRSCPSLRPPERSESEAVRSRAEGKAAYEAKRDSYNRAYGVCWGGRGYTVK
jgi:hypothetical protein